MSAIKRIMITVVCLCLILGANVNAMAAETRANTAVMGFEPLWQNVASIGLNMTFSNGTVTSTSTVSGQAGTTAISATFTLSRRNTNGTLTAVDTWTATHGTNTRVLTSLRTTRNQSAGTYQLRISASVTRNGTVETVTESLVMALR